MTAMTVDRYFPRGALDPDQPELDSFLSDWFSKHLRAMGEPSVSDTKGTSEFTYRLLLLPTFDNPISVRIQKSGTSTIVHAIRLDGAGGYGPGRIAAEIQRELAPTELEALLTKLDKARFWQMRSKEDGMCLDGTEWILEGRRNGKYSVVRRWSAGGDFYDACLFFLKLSGITVPAVEIY
jgi:hypothetical protein